MDIEKAKIMLQKRRDNMYLWFSKYKKKTDRINKCKKKEFTDEQALKYITSYDKVPQRAHAKYRERLCLFKTQAKPAGAFNGVVEL